MVAMRLQAISLLLHAYVGWRLVPGLDSPVGAVALAVLLLVSALTLPYGLGARRGGAGRGAAALAWIGLVCMGLFSSLFVLTAVRDAGLLVAIAAALVTLWGFANARRVARVVRVDVPIAGLPAALDGFAIAQISDVHVGPTIKRPYVEAIVDAVNRLEVDLVAITGDLVDGSVRDLAEHVAPLAGLRAKDGVFFVTGNHEYYSGAAAWVGELRRLGFTVLLNEHAVVRRGDARLVVAGVTDFSAGHFDGAE